jgi:hypothetical protein
MSSRDGTIALNESSHDNLVVDCRGLIMANRTNAL